MTTVTMKRENHVASYARCSAFCWRGERKTRPRPSITKSTRNSSAMAASTSGGAQR